jgi:hypothetical protein
MADIFSCPEDKRQIREQRDIIEYYRDFIIWLCEEECNSTVMKMEEEFKKFEEKIEQQINK